MKILWLIFPIFCSVEALQMGPVETISKDFKGSVQPQVDINEKGDAVVHWYSLVGQGKMGLLTSLRGLDKGWACPEFLPYIAQEGEGSTAARIHDDGGVTILLRKKRPPGDNCYVFSKEKGRAWRPPDNLFRQYDFLNYFDHKGRWLCEAMLPHRIGEAISDSKGLLRREGDRTTVCVSVNVDKKGFAFWTFQQGVSTGWFSSRLDQTLQGIEIQGEKTSSSIFDIALDKGFENSQFFSSVNNCADGALIWQASNGNEQRILTASGSGNTWSQPTILAQSTGKLLQPRITLDDQGHQVAVWYEFKEEDPYLFVAHRCAGGPWSPPKIFPDSQGCQTYRVTSAGPGRVVIIWSDALAAHGAEFSFETCEWKSTQLISSKQILLGSPSCAFNSKGEGVIAWAAFDEQADGSYIHVAELKLD